MSGTSQALAGRRVTGVVALGPRSMAVGLGPPPKSYLWIHLERKEARLALASELPIPPDPRGSPFGALESPIRGHWIVAAGIEAGRGLDVRLAPGPRARAALRFTVESEGPRINLVLRSIADGTVLWALHREEVGGGQDQGQGPAPGPGPSPAVARPSRVLAAESEDEREALRATIARSFQEDFARERRRALAGAERTLARRIEALEGDLRRARDRMQDRRRAEILLAHYAEIPRGASRAGLPDPYADSPGSKIEIELDPSRSPHENADRLFRSAKRGERGVTLVESRLGAARDAAAKLIELRRVLETLPPREASERLAAFLEEAGLRDPTTRGGPREIRLGLRTTAAPRASRPGRRPPGAHKSIGPRTFHTSDGWEVWVGRNNSDNDRITHRLSNPHDLWLHVVGVPGSHVILRRPSRNAIPKPRTLGEAASIAAYFSKARKLARVPVIYTERKFVTKPRRGKPGQALCTREREILVRPRLPELPENSTDTKNRRREESS